jgi:cation:H+ antiporter
VIQTWIWFVTLTLVIVFAGTWLSRYGDAIAEKTGLGRTWVGVIMMATVTSLPELITGGSAVLIYDLPDIAAGDALGSCMFNVLILVVVDVASPHPISARVHHGHLVSGAFTIVLLGLAAWALLAGAAAPAVGWVGLHSALFIVIYLLAVRAVMAHEAARPAPPAAVAVGASAPEHGILTLRGALVRYGLTAVVLVAAATFLPAVGDRLAIETGLARSFVGNLFIAASTSLPEFVVSVAAVRLGAADLAVGNLFGSNLFNIAILGIEDVLYGRGVLLAVASPDHLFAVLGAMTMTGIAMAALAIGRPRKRFRVGWETVALFAVYLVTAVSLYRGTL